MIQFRPTWIMLLILGWGAACQTTQSRWPAESPDLDSGSLKTRRPDPDRNDEPSSDTPPRASQASEPAPLTPPPWLEELLEQSSTPSGVVILEGDGSLSSLSGHQGFDPARLALRPGSTLKPLLAWGAAQAGQRVASNYTCTRDFEPVPPMHCFARHGALSLPQAIERSCNTFFFQIANDWGVRAVTENLRHFGFGARTGLVPHEGEGTLLTEDQLAELPNDTFPPQTWAPLIATGHGPIQVTLLQLTRAYARLVNELQTPSSVPHLAEVSQLIQTGLARVVGGDNGTAHDLASLPFAVAGKTGSAEGGDFRDTPNADPGNSFFVGFFPPEAPRYFVGVATLKAGSARAHTLPLAAGVFSRLGAPND